MEGRPAGGGRPYHLDRTLGPGVRQRAVLRLAAGAHRLPDRLRGHQRPDISGDTNSRQGAAPLSGGGRSGVGALCRIRDRLSLLRPFSDR